MSNRLSVAFDGLMSMVPLRKAGDEKPAESWIAALPDLRRTLPAFAPIQRAIAPHVAGVVVRDEAVVDAWSDKEPSLVFESRRAPGRRLRLYEMHEEGLKLKYEGKSGLKTVVEALKSAVPTAGQNRDLTWVAQLHRVGLNDAGVFDRRLFDNNLLPAPNAGGKGHGARGLTGVVELTSGTLTVDDVVRDLDGKPLVFEFRPIDAAAGQKQAHQQAQGGHVLLEDTVIADQVQLIFLQPDSAGPKARIVHLRQLDGRFEVRVANMELEMILGVGNPHAPVAAGGSASADADFAIHYMMSPAWPFPDLPVPHPIGTNAFGGQRESCKSGAFQGLG